MSILSLVSKLRMKQLGINFLNPRQPFQIQTFPKLLKQRIHVDTPQICCLVYLSLEFEHKLCEPLETIGDFSISEPMFRESEDHNQKVVRVV